MSEASVLAISLFLIWTLTSLGMLYDKSVYAWPNEFIRSSVFMVLYHYFGTWNEFRIPVEILDAVFIASLVIGALATVNGVWTRIGGQIKKAKVETNGTSEKKRKIKSN